MKCQCTECHSIIKPTVTTKSCHVNMESAWGIYEHVGFTADMWRAALDKNRPFGAEKSLQPSLILAGESLNDTSCLSLWTRCQADANLLAGDVLLRCPCSSRAPFSIHSHFYCRCRPLHCSEMAFLADSTGVWVCVWVKWVRCPWLQLIIIIKDMSVAPETEWNMS